MRTVVASDDVVWLWWTRAQVHARNKTGNLYFTGDTIYSYGSHFPIASWVSGFADDAVLFTAHGYSATTAKHKCEVQRRIRQVPHWTVPQVVIRSHKDHDDNINWFNEYIHNKERLLADETVSMRGGHREHRLQELQDLLERARDYHRFFAAVRCLEEPDEQFFAVQRYRARREALQATKNKARRERDLERRRQREEAQRLEEIRLLEQVERNQRSSFGRRRVIRIGDYG